MTVVTTRLGDDIGGMTVSAFSSVAMEPPLVLVCLTIDKQTTKYVAESGWYGVNILMSGQEEISNSFAYKDFEDRFHGVAWTAGPNGIPLIDGTLAALECRVVQTHVAGDHIIFVGEAVHSRINDGEPVMYTQGRYRVLADGD